MGSIRRTHISSDLGPDRDGEEVVVMGWVAAIRSHGNIAFATIYDRAGPIQIVAKKGTCSDIVRNQLAGAKTHSSVAIRGRASASARAPQGVEIIPDDIIILSEASRTPPFEPAAVSIPNIDTRLEARYIDLRREPLRHMFGARTAVLRTVREYFYTNHFTEISTPKMISSATEGGASLFSIFYYDKGAFLAQSPQLYKEQLTMSFERVFEIAPIFRAEPSRTNRHLAEAISIDMEEAFADYNDIMDRTVEVIRHAVDAAHTYTEQNPGAEYTPPDASDIPRYTYGELADRIHDETNMHMAWGDDIHPSWLRRLGLDGLYFITDWPMGPKPFYVKTKPDDPKISESFDLMWGDLELSSGSTRINCRDDLEQNLQKKGMNTASFEHHLGAFEYGMPPHAGCGIGLERLMMALTGTANIRDATFYPRDVDRLTP